MLWTWPTSWYANPWNELERLQREMTRLFEPFARISGSQGNFPAVNIWTGEDEAILTAEIPGVDPKELEITVKNDTVTIRGRREPEELKEGESYLRQERGAGTFVRAFSLPFHVDDSKVTARYHAGILELTLPRREEDKPKKITVATG